MAKQLIAYLCAGSLLISISCTNKTSSSRTTKSASTYQEDISVYRPKYDTKNLLELSEATNVSETPLGSVAVEPTFDITPRLNNLLDSMARNSRGRQVQGFTIQVYSGNNREQANEAKTMVYRLLPNARPDTKYVQPNYKVKVGKFLNRFEAQAMYAKLKSEFPNVLVVPEKFSIN